MKRVIYLFLQLQITVLFVYAQPLCTEVVSNNQKIIYKKSGNTEEECEQIFKEANRIRESISISKNRNKQNYITTTNNQNKNIIDIRKFQQGDNNE